MLRLGLLALDSVSAVAVHVERTQLHLETETDMAAGRMDKVLWGVVAVLGGWCLLTMVLVPLLAVSADAYLTLTGRYVLASVIAVVGGATALWWWQRRGRPAASHDV